MTRWCILWIPQSYKKDNSQWHLIYKNFYKQVGFLLLLSIATILIEKIPDPSNIKKPTKLVKRSKIIFEQAKTLGRPNIFGIKSAIMEHPETSNKLLKTIKQAEKVSQVSASGAGKNSNSSLNSKTNKSEGFWMKKKMKKSQNDHTAIKVMRVLIMSKFWILLIFNYILKILNQKLKIN